MSAYDEAAMQDGPNKSKLLDEIASNFNPTISLERFEKQEGEVTKAYYLPRITI